LVGASIGANTIHPFLLDADGSGVGMKPPTCPSIVYGIDGTAMVPHPQSESDAALLNFSNMQHREAGLMSAYEPHTHHSVVIEGNEIVGNVCEGVAVGGSGCDPWIDNNTVCSGGGTGLLFGLCSRGVATNNLVASNSGSGCVVTSGSWPVLRENGLLKNVMDGLSVHTGGLGIDVGNDVY
jgi:hypothetical protein